MKIFATGNQQFGRKGAIKKFNREFSSVADMNDAMINAWNSVVSDNDHVYVLGNFAWDPITSDEVLGKLNGYIHLVKGEYDTATESIADLHETYLNVCEADIIIDNERNMCLSYWPLGEWPKKSKGYKMVTSFIGNKWKSNHKENIINVNCDRWSFKPVELDNVNNLFNEIDNLSNEVK